MSSQAIGAICLSLCALFVEGIAQPIVDFGGFAPAAPSVTKVPPAMTIALPMDHFGTNNATFNNRY